MTWRNSGDGREGTQKQSDRVRKERIEQSFKTRIHRIALSFRPYSGGNRTNKIILAAVNIARCLRPALPNEIARPVRLGEV